MCPESVRVERLVLRLNQSLEVQEQSLNCEDLKLETARFFETLVCVYQSTGVTSQKISNLASEIVLFRGYPHYVIHWLLNIVLRFFIMISPCIFHTIQFYQQNAHTKNYFFIVLLVLIYTPTRVSVLGPSSGG
jgi:hypothetical protein